MGYKINITDLKKEKVETNNNYNNKLCVYYTTDLNEDEFNNIVFNSENENWLDNNLN